MFTTHLSTIGVLKDLHIIYLPLRGIAFLADDASVAIIHRICDDLPLSKDELDTPVYQQLIELNVLGETQEPRLCIEPLQEYKPVKATILLTESCNLGCTYCYANAVPSKSRISWNILSVALDLIVENASASPERRAAITYLGGGEPSIYWGMLVQATEYARQKCTEKKVQLRVTLVTNGTLLNEERVRWLAANIDHISLSFDILPEIQQLQRPYAGGQNSHSRVLRTAHLLFDYGCSFGIRSTITANSVHYLTEMVVYAHKYMNVKRLHFEPLSESGRSLGTITYAPNQEAFVTAFMNARRRGKELGIEVECSMSRNVDKLQARFCENEFSITAEGLVTACHRYSREESNSVDTFMYGRFDGNTFIIDVNKINQIRSINAQNYEACSKCFAKWNCGGDCLAARIDHDQISDIGPRCNLIRGVVKEMLLERITSGE